MRLIVSGELETSKSGAQFGEDTVFDYLESAEAMDSCITECAVVLD